MDGTGDALELNPLDDPAWMELVVKSPAATVFHHPRWLALLRRTYGYGVTACAVAGDDGRLIAGVPVAAVSSRLTGRRLVALPFADVCPPLLSDDAGAWAPTALHEALAAFQAHRGVPLEVRGTGEALRNAPSGERFRHHILALASDVGTVERGFLKPQVLRGVRRARREGLTARVATDRGALAAFYRLHVATRRRLGVATQPRRFILGFEALFAEGLGFVLLVSRGEQPLAAGLFLTFGDTLLYKYGASDARFLVLRPNNLLFMEAIRWGCTHGMRRLDFGRTHWHHESLRAFKLAWGAEEHELRYRQIGGPSGRGSERATAFLGTLIRRSPPAVGRAIGEVLYRHAG
ncbi:MAG TPA: GNAT family N-acetyltransferase [Solirubrobacteraceae bacterium]|nr:GNAT family N-acetyltransferase [Solirubrobacteraceae bacterium]